MDHAAHPGIPARRRRRLLTASLLGPAMALAAAACAGDQGAGGPGPAVPAALAGPCVAAGIPAVSVDPGLDLLDQLKALPDVATVEDRTPPGGARFFVLGFDQPVDHCDPAGPRFTQRATLLFRDPAAPTVLHTSGYDLSLDQRQVGITALLGANQVRLEHRYFDASTPAPDAWPTPDAYWSRLDVFQAATDQHRVARILQALLAGRWLNTGGSKGGMTAVYHRAFYPDDVQATLAYVAPQSFGPSDPRFAGYLDAIGPAGCRTALKAAQRALLEARAEIEPLMAAAAAAAVPPDGYSALGLDKAFEVAVVELPFAFWQYGGEYLCAGVPGAGATAAELWAFMEGVYGVAAPPGVSGTAAWTGDAALDFYAAYYYQSATQLGGPAYPEAHLLDLLGPGGAGDVPAIYTPLGVAKPFDARAMRDVDAWVTARGERMMFVYGGRDPWSGGQFTPGPGRDAVRYVAPLANHGAGLSLLGAADKAAAAAALGRWMGVPVVLPRLESDAGAAASREAAAWPDGLEREPEARRWRL